MGSPNRLSREKSPYLLQHALNPVDWHAWSAEAFEKAAREDKPILLSIGYSTCHWCHVMEHESFEDAATARLMNEHYISIKVDREERPDIDHVYMEYLMATTGRGGWPMTVFLTPDRKPFYGGTYFPPADRYGMPGFKTLLVSIAEAWKTRREEILNSAESAAVFLNQKNETAPGQDSPLTEALLEQGALALQNRFDEANGGFGGAPKFPMGHSISFLLRFYKRSGQAGYLKIAEKTLQAMADGGLCDQLGGGFHRYSTDYAWRVPHFEKMLYDQALLAPAYTDAYRITGNPFYEKTVRETLDYVLNQMTGPEGAFFSAEDADSVDPESSKKSEGAYYLWSLAQVRSVLSEEESEAFIRYYGLQEKGNYLEDPHGELAGKNVLYRVGQEEVPVLIAEAGKKILAERQKRKRPHLDDKILTDWNGLMIAAFARASAAFRRPAYLQAAEKAAVFISQALLRKDGRLWHRYRDKEAAIEANLDDYAFFVHALLEIHQAGLDDKWLVLADGLMKKALELFWDQKRGAFYLSPKDAADLLTRPKTSYDGAVPSGNSFAALNLIRLSRLLENENYASYAEKTLQAFAADMTNQPSGHTQMLQALDWYLGPSREITLNEGPDPKKTAEFLKVIHLNYYPNQLLRRKPAEAGQPSSATVCKNRACLLPVHDGESLGQILIR